MSSSVRIALDVMGGDHGADVVLPGAEIALIRHPDIRFLLFGDEKIINAQLAARPRLAAASQVFHTDVVVRMDDKPSQALRRGRRVSSMWRAIDVVRTGEADCAVSAGNTGALMAMAKFQLRPLDGIQRAAIAAVVLGMKTPLVALLNIGTEEVKGNEHVKLAAQMLRDANLPIQFEGFVEGDDISAGTVDVVVTDGFSGNIALKSAEGAARLVAYYLQTALKRSWISMLGAAIASGAFKVLRAKMDPRTSNGGVFLGLNGTVVKSHGGTDGLGFASAIDLAIEMTRQDMTNRIAADIAGVAAILSRTAPAVEPQAEAPVGP